MIDQITRQNRIGLQFRLYKVQDGTCIVRLDNQTSITVSADINRLNQSWFYWQVKGDYIQDAFDYLNAGEREFLISGIRDDEFQKLFKEED